MLFYIYKISYLENNSNTFRNPFLNLLLHILLSLNMSLC